MSGAIGIEYNIRDSARGTLWMLKAHSPLRHINLKRLQRYVECYDVIQRRVLW